MDEPGGSTAFRIDQTLEAVDSRSSSLSDLDDAQDEHAMTSPDIIATKLEADLENDSEAETERLDQITPKPRRGTLSDGMFTAEKTSSALSRQVEIDSDIGEEATPSRHVRQEDFEGVLDDDEDATEGLGEAPSPRKRKRSSSEGSPLSDAMDIDEPARKRAHPAEDDEDEEVIEDDEDNEVLADEEGEPAADGSLDDEQEDDTELADGDLVQDEPMEGASLDETQPARPVKGKKGKRKGKKMKGTDIGMEYAIGEGSGLPDAAVEAVADQEAEGEAEEEDPAAVDEERK